MRGLELNDHLTEVHAEFVREDQVRRLGLGLDESNE